MLNIELKTIIDAYGKEINLKKLGLEFECRFSEFRDIEALVNYYLAVLFLSSGAASALIDRRI